MGSPMISSIRMQMSARRWLAPAVLLLLLTPPAHAQQTVLTLDPAKTIVSFTLHDVLHTVHGTFQLKSGAITFNPITGKAAGSVVVDATSGDSGNHGRDSRMHREILESAKYPEISFAPVAVTGAVALQGDSHVEVRGIFKLHGEEHEIEIPADVHINGAELTADMKFPLKYVQWGVKNPSTFILRVSDTLEIEVHTSARLAPPDPN
jgi:polyisoprenoid-binding protein YceI